MLNVSSGQLGKELTDKLAVMKDSLAKVEQGYAPSV